MVTPSTAVDFINMWEPKVAGAEAWLEVVVIWTDIDVELPTFVDVAVTGAAVEDSCTQTQF